jgi:hypothetical protein
LLDCAVAAPVVTAVNATSLVPIVAVNVNVNVTPPWLWPCLSLSMPPCLFLLKLQDARCEKSLVMLKEIWGCKPEVVESMKWKKQNTAALLAELDRLKPDVEAAIEDVKCKR